MNEIEVKILDVDVKKLETDLVNLGAQKTFAGDLVWTAFDFPDRSLFNREILIRLRQMGDKTTLTYKKLLSSDEAKVSQEKEVIVDDFEAMKEILIQLGLAEKRGYPMNKHRVSYVLGEVRFEIDTLPGLPSYLEIEGPSNEVIKDMAHKLGFSDSEIKPWGTREVFAHYRAK